MGKIILSFLVLMVLFSVFPAFASAQENDVCLVYFTGTVCGDDCGLTDTFMDGLMYEYLNLIAIKYNIDASQGNMDVFGAYRETYGLPNEVPIVLFGVGDYLQGKNDIYRNTETKILSFLNQDGSNCPLESGYAPPGEVSSIILPGDPEILESEIQDMGDGEEVEEGDENGGGIVIGWEEVDIVSAVQDLLESEYFPTLVLLTAMFIIVIFAISLSFGRKGAKRGE